MSFWIRQKSAMFSAVSEEISAVLENFLDWTALNQYKNISEAELIVEFWKVALTIAKEESTFFFYFAPLLIAPLLSFKRVYQIQDTSNWRSIHK